MENSSLKSIDANRRPAGGATTLRSEASVFSRHASPRIIAVTLAALIPARLALGHWRWWDLIIGMGVLAGAPFGEWVIHVFVLHFRPREVLGRPFDPVAARYHRAHHRDPRDLRYLFIPLQVLIPVLVVWSALTFFVADNMRLAFTAELVGFAFIFGYEWTHHLIHSTYVPRTSAYRHIWRNHRLHHYKNERYWFGITSDLSDRVLHTNPDKEAVATSPTAMTLGLEEAV
jgi:fatty acid hydroxylase family protein